MADFGRLWDVGGVSWRRAREVFSTGWPPGGPREGSGINLASFWMDLGDIFGALGIIVDGFCDFLWDTLTKLLSTIGFTYSAAWRQRPPCALRRQMVG